MQFFCTYYFDPIIPPSYIISLSHKTEIGHDAHCNIIIQICCNLQEFKIDIFKKNYIFLWIYKIHSREKI
jgi:hypothetical protein